MSAGDLAEKDEPVILELDGPPMAYIEIPLDYWATPNGELEAEGHPEATRLIQRIPYMNFRFISPDASKSRLAAQAVILRVRERLKEIGGGFIWWRKHPVETNSTEAEEDSAGEPRTQVSLRLGTSPALPNDWWVKLSDELGNANEPRRMLGGGG